MRLLAEWPEEFLIELLDYFDEENQQEEMQQKTSELKARLKGAS